MQSSTNAICEQGYFVVEGAYTKNECFMMRYLMDTHEFRTVHFSQAVGERNFTKFYAPMLDAVPDMALYYANEHLIGVMEEILGGEIVLKNSGGMWFDLDNATGFLKPWHTHLDKFAEPYGHRERPQRLLCNVYVDGSDDNVGPLYVLPRKLNDPIEEREFTNGEDFNDWPGQVKVEMNPGDAIIMDTPVWHMALNGNGNAWIRRIWGGHYQRKDDPLGHEDDNFCGNPILDKHKEELPILRGLLGG